MKEIKKAVIPAAGFGTRFLPITKSVPKELLPIVDTPALSYIIKEGYNSGIKEFLIIINEGKESIKEYFTKNKRLEEFLKEKGKKDELKLINEFQDIKIEFCYQYEQKGLGHAVYCAKDFVKNEPFVLMLGDDVYYSEKEEATLQMINKYKLVNSSILGTLEVSINDVNKYGICNPIDNKNTDFVKLKGVVEKPNKDEAPSRMAIGGRYILTPTIFEYLETQEPGKGGEIQLTDSILRLLEKEDVYALNLDAKRYDIGSKSGFIEATIDYALRKEDLKLSIKNIIKEKYEEI